jgi:3'(2'), 5'-bisphosphate nucleotidase
MLEKIDLETIVSIAKEAGDAIMKIYNRDFQIDYKDDESPLTEADTRSNEIICAALTKAYPEIPLLSEENKEVPYKERKGWEYFWLIDPIDGTKEFIKKNGEFTVNIALIHKETPVLGVVYAPALEDMYYAAKGKGAFKAIVNDEFWMLNGKENLQNAKRLPLQHNNDPENTLTIVASKSHMSDETKDFIDHLTFNIQHPTFISKGSSLKLVMVAEGTADIYPRLAPTMEWDTAAADAIVREAGKMTYQYTSESGILNPEPLTYNKDSLLNPWFIVQ